jgi:hypothetical protein
LGLPQFTEAPIYLDLWPLAVLALLVWFCIDMVLEEFRQQRYNRDRQFLEVLLHLEQKDRK